MVIEDLGKKVEWIEGLLGYAFAREHFADRTIQAALHLKTPSQWSRKKTGHPIQPWELRHLFDHFKLPDKLLNHGVFALPYEKFQDALKQAGVGVHGLGDEHRIRQALLSDRRCEHGGIVCRHLGRGEQRGGFGLDEEHSKAKPRPFKIGDRATIQVNVRENGYLLLLNDQMPIGETTCLVPSVFAVTTAVRAGNFVVPQRGIAAVDVQGPPGWYRLFAIWTRTPISLPWAKDDDAEQAPRSVTPGEFFSLHKLLRERDKADDYSIQTTEYQVVDRP